MIVWADARAVRPYMHSSSSSYQLYGNAISPISPRNLTHFTRQLILENEEKSKLVQTD